MFGEWFRVDVWFGPSADGVDNDQSGQPAEQAG